MTEKKTPIPPSDGSATSGEHKSVREYERSLEAGAELSKELRRESQRARAGVDSLDDRLRQYVIEHKECVLVVDDDPGIRESLLEALGSEGFSVHVAEDGLRGLVELDAMRRPDVILLDLAMPRYDGWAFLAFKDRTEFWDVPVLIISGAASLEGSKEEGDFVFLRKPVNFELLLRTIRIKIAETRARRERERESRGG